MNKRNLIFFIVLLILCSFSAKAQISALQVLNKASEQITKNKGTEAKFIIQNTGYTESGSIKTAANKFAVELPNIKIWYNGKDMYTYNQKTSETTLVVPTAEELAESNPLNYVISASKTYNVNYSTVKKTGKYVLDLQPKSKNEIKRITLTIDQKNYYPEKIVIEPFSGTPVTVEIKSFETGKNFPSSDFVYPEEKYSKAELIDLR